jgi:hypothetical protein
MDTRDGGDKGSKSTATTHDPERGTAAVTPDPEKGSGAAGGETSHGAAKSPEAEYAVEMWVAGFASASTERMRKVSALPFSVNNEVAAENQKDLGAMYEGLIVESGALKSYDVLTPAEYAKETGSPVELPTGSLVLVVRAKETFAVVFVPTKSGEYRATMVVR